MHLIRHQDDNEASINRLLTGVPFYNEVSRLSADEFNLLLENTRYYFAQENEWVINDGDKGPTLFFLLRGKLDVYREENASCAVYSITPGEVFGAVSALLGTPRTAAIRVASGCKEAVLAEVDFARFNVDKGQHFSLPVKIAFYKMLMHHLRWTLEVKRMQTPNHELIKELFKLPVVNTQQHDQLTLNALQKQTKALAELLCVWNEEITPCAVMQ